MLLFSHEKYPKNVTLFATGPLTNLALAAKVFPEVRDLVKEIYIMGGNIRGVGNASSAAEFNFFWDPEAAHIVLELFNCKKTILPWETCSPDSISIPLVRRRCFQIDFLLFLIIMIYYVTHLSVQLILIHFLLAVSL